ncbi:MAG: DUF4268 domain-containing protein, partial [Crocinitomicaceae bacterium]
RVSSSGRRVNWSTYPTKVKNTYLRLISDGKLTSVCYDVQFKDEGIQAIFWEQLGELKKVLEETMKHPTKWDNLYMNAEGIKIGRISWELENVNFYNDEDWATIHQFFKDRLIEFDAFYQEFKDILISLVD